MRFLLLLFIPFLSMCAVEDDEVSYEKETVWNLYRKPAGPPARSGFYAGKQSSPAGGGLAGRRSPNYFASGDHSGRMIGGTIYRSEGSLSRRIGNTYYHSDGESTRSIGNTLYHSNGEPSRRIGSTYYHSSGETSRKIGNTMYHSDGSTTRRIGNTLYHSGGF